MNLKRNRYTICCTENNIVCPKTRLTILNCNVLCLKQNKIRLRRLLHCKNMRLLVDSRY